MKHWLISLLLLLTTAVQAAPQYWGKVKGFYVNNKERVMVKLDTATPQCGDVTWSFYFKTSDPAADAWISLLLMAKASGQTISVGYIPNTSENEQCGVEYFSLYN